MDLIMAPNIEIFFNSLLHWYICLKGFWKLLLLSSDVFHVQTRIRQ